MQYAIMSEAGSREENEDYADGIMQENTEEGCFVLCDGLGGHGQGEVASHLIVGEILTRYKKSGCETEFLERAMMESHASLLQLQKEKHAQSEMKTTVVVLLVNETEIRWCHVGDSRLYFFEKGKLKQRTLDHSVPQMLVTAGEIREKEIRHHPDRNRLLRVMGMEWDSPKYTLSEPVARGTKQAFLLCSDGFWELIEEKQMEKCLRKARNPEEWLLSMEEIVLKNGESSDMDNFTAVAVMI